MPTLLDIKKKITRTLLEDNEKIRHQRIIYALDYADYAAVSFLRRVQLMRLPGDYGYHKVDYDYKIWKAKRMLARYFLTDVGDVMARAGGKKSAARVHFLDAVPRLLEEAIKLKDTGRRTEVVLDSAHIVALRECFTDLKSYTSDYLGDETEHAFERLQIKLEVYELKYAKLNMEGSVRDRWDGQTEAAKKIRML
jgi:hypothetical protein